MTEKNVIEILEKRRGVRSIRELAAELKCSPTFVSDVLRGTRPPTPKLLKKIGLQRVKTVKYIEVSK